MNILICGTNWLGDSIMSMPAVQMLKERESDCCITMLVKPWLEPLWAMHASVDRVLTIKTGMFGTISAGQMVEYEKFDKAFIFPNSFRSVLIPFLGHVPVRMGMAGHHRAWMLTDIVGLVEDNEHNHQMWEYVRIVSGRQAAASPDVPRLAVPPSVTRDIMKRLNIMHDDRLVGIIPGSAYGPAKRWPSEYFADVGRQLLSENKSCHVAVLGAEKERCLCAEVADGIGERAVNFAGETSIKEMAALLSLCSVVVSNDSGGMHLAAAVGTKVVAVFGITDPFKTGPIGSGHKIISQKDVSRSRDIARDSREADDCLRSIKPDRVISAIMEVLS